MVIKSRPRPVMMTPLRRCGSHALRLRLNKSPDFYAPYPLHVIDFMPLLQYYDDLEDDNQYFQLITDLVGLQSTLMVKWPDLSLDPVEIFESIKDQPRSIHTIVWEMLFISGRKQNASVVMDKSLDSIQYADELLSLYPDMLFLNVVRDPRAQISSMNKAIIYDYHSLPNAMYWSNAYRLANDLSQRYPDRVMTIRFEDFIQDEASTLKGICDFFEIRFTEDMLDIKSSAEAKSIFSRSALWESNHSKPIAANIDKFKSSLSDDEINTIETICTEFMDLYGYEKMTSANAIITDTDIREAQKLSEENRQQAWKDLAVKDPRDYMLRKFRQDYLNMLRNRLSSNAFATLKASA